jgi:hypothetical protein
MHLKEGEQIREVYTWDSYVVAETGHPYYMSATGEFSSGIVFESVNANDITDHMTMKIVSVNGIDAETIAKTGYIRISTGKIKKKTAGGFIFRN